VNPIEELSGATASESLLTGLGPDEYFQRTDSNGSLSFMRDALGSTIALTTQAGALQGQYTYDPFGETSVNNSASDNSFQFTGRENDGTGLYFYRARYYNPVAGRFLSEDPLRIGGGVNLYEYAADDPIDLADPAGDEPCLDIDEFVDWLDQHATPHCTRGKNGHCAKNVRLGLQKGGLDTRIHPIDAKNYGPFLQQLGFSPVPSDNYTPQTGDIVVLQPPASDPTGSGHVESWDGNTWISDIMQCPKNISPYGTTPPYSIYRSSNPCPPPTNAPRQDSAPNGFWQWVLTTFGRVWF
jgi:RHS repeat-associated protein